MRLVSHLLQSPEKYEVLYERYSASIVFRLGHGRTIETGEEPFVKTMVRQLRNFEHATTPGTYLVDIFPMLLHLLMWLAPFKKFLLANQAENRAVFSELQETVRQQSEVSLMLTESLWHLR